MSIFWTECIGVSCTHSRVLNHLWSLLISEINPWVWTYLFWKIASFWRNRAALPTFQVWETIDVDTFLQNLKNSKCFSSIAVKELFQISLIFVFELLLSIFPRWLDLLPLKTFCILLYHIEPQRMSRSTAPENCLWVTTYARLARFYKLRIPNIALVFLP